MDPLKKKYLIIDWGFTRFKLWLLDNKKNICKKKSIDNNQICPHPEFYKACDLRRIANNIIDFINDQELDGEMIHIHHSCQMHGISGLIEDSVPFFSTWNDLPSYIINNQIESINGNPLLISMPINKICVENKKLFLKTRFLTKSMKKAKVQIEQFMTPFELIYKHFLGLDISTSSNLWESTCISQEYLSKQNKFSTYKTYINPKENKLFNSPFNVKIYPEIGDLQASTYSSIKRSDIVINLGTGSQIVFKKLDIKSKINFYRNYPGIGKLPVISHIPCGRLFAEYCSNSQFNFEDILEEFDKLDFETFRKIIINSRKKLLFFPGFDVITFKYENNPEVNIKNIIEYSPKILICNWLNQYVEIINYFSKQHHQSKIKVNISGELGGITIKAIKILRKCFPQEFKFQMTNYDIPNSIIECNEYY